MAEIVGLAASLGGLIQLAEQVGQYFRHIRHPPPERRKLQNEVLNVTGLLTLLQNQADESPVDTWTNSMNLLVTPQGPLDQLEALLHRLASKFTEPKEESNGSRMKQMHNKGVTEYDWPFSISEGEEFTYFHDSVVAAKTVFLLALQDEDLQLAKKIDESVAELHNAPRMLSRGLTELEDVQEARERRIQQQIRSDILTWLSPLQFERKQNDLWNRHEEETGLWLLVQEQYQKWRDESTATRTLYCLGNPGAGKSILASIAINDLCQRFADDSEIGIAYVFCSHKDHLDQTLENLTGALLRQLATKESHAFPSPLPDAVISLYEKYRYSDSRPSVAEYFRVLRLRLPLFSTVLIVVDGLDECVDSGKFLRELSCLLKDLRNVKLMVMARPIAISEEFLRSVPQIQVVARDEDIKKYLETEINKRPRLHAHTSKNQSLVQDIVRIITEKANGIFLLAQLHIDTITIRPTVKKIREALAMMPTNLYDAYENAMERVFNQEQEDRALAKTVISWAAYSLRPTTIKELQHALAIEIDTQDLDKEAVPDEDLLVSVCSGLLRIDRDRDYLGLVHRTCQEYFDQNQERLFPGIRTDFATKILTHVSYERFGEGFIEDKTIMKLELQDSPVMEYASQYWGAHARLADQSNRKLKETAVKFLKERPKVEFVLQVVHWHASHGRSLFPHGCVIEDTGLRQDATAILIAAAEGLPEVLDALIEKNEDDLHARNSRGQMMLAIAAENGRESIIRMLLNKQNRVIRLDDRDNIGQTALSVAAHNGHQSIVEVLLSQPNVDPNSQDKSGTTALSLAALNGHEGVVKLFLDREDVNAELCNYKGQTPLSFAASSDNLPVLRMFMNNPNLDINCTDEDGRTPLSLAAERGFGDGIQKILSDPRADPNKQSKSGRTPLSYAAQYNYAAVVDTLLHHEGVKADQADKLGRTPLSWAAEAGAVETMRLLLIREEVNPDSISVGGRTPFSYAAGGPSDRFEEVGALLMERQISIDSKDHTGRTPLSWAAVRNEEAVRILLEWGAAPEVPDNSSRTPLHWAAENGQEITIHRLLERKVTADTMDIEGRTPLSLAAGNRHWKAVRELLKGSQAIDIDSRSNAGRSPLSYAAEGGSGFGDVARELIMRRADVNSKDNDGQTPLSWAARVASNEMTVKLLLKWSTDPELADKDGKKPLDWANSTGNGAVAKLLTGELPQGLFTTIADAGQTTSAAVTGS